MPIKTSKIGVVFVVIFVLLIVACILMVPASFGFSILFIGELSMPWNEFISGFLPLEYGSMSLSAVGPGLIINGIILYSLGYAIDKFMRDRKSN